MKRKLLGVVLVLLAVLLVAQIHTVLAKPRPDDGRCEIQMLANYEDCSRGCWGHGSCIRWATNTTLCSITYYCSDGQTITKRLPLMPLSPAVN